MDVEGQAGLLCPWSRQDKIIPALHCVLAVIAVQRGEYVMDSSWNDSGDIREIGAIFTVSVTSLHRVGLSSTSLSIGKDGAVEALEHLLHNRCDCLIVQAFLSGIRSEDLEAYTSQATSLCEIEWLRQQCCLHLPGCPISLDCCRLVPLKHLVISCVLKATNHLHQ